MLIDRVFATATSAVYRQAAVELPHGMEIVADERVSQWSIVARKAAKAKVVFFAPVFGRMFHIGYTEYAQLLLSLYLLSFANQRALTPIRSRHLTVGMNLVNARKVRDWIICWGRATSTRSN